MNDDRRNRIIRLLETRDDNLPAMRTTKIHGSTSGFVHEGRTLTCEDCLANGRVRYGCETCHGTGRIPDPSTKDPMDEPLKNPPPDPRRKAYFGGNAGEERVDHARAIDTAIIAAERELSRLLAPPSEGDLIAEANKHPEPWEIERRRMYRDYDYAALDQAVEHLRDEQPSMCGIVHSVYVYGIVEASAVIEELSERGLRFIDDRMPDEIRAPGFRHPQQDAIERRRSVA